MKKIVSIFTVAAALISGNAFAALRGDIAPYLSGKVGYARSWIADEHSYLYEFDHGYKFGMPGVFGAFGVDYQAGQEIAIRQEIEVSYARDWSSKHTEFGILGALANVYVDFGRNIVRPYIGFGLGVAEVTGMCNHPYADCSCPISFAHSAFDWGLYAGLNFHLTRHWALDLGARYNRVEILNHGPDFQTFGGTFGARYRF